jgi:glycosyltransferase involved in cell wall biosynthesis
MRQIVIIIAGRDPTMQPGGSESYSRASGRAALLAGYEPHLFCVGTATRTETTAFGVLHCVRSPIRPLRGLMVAMHQRYIVGAVARFASELRLPRGSRCIIHSVGNWSGVAEAAARRLARTGLDCRIVATVFSTYNHETRGKLQGVGRPHGLWTQVELRWEMLWTRLTVDPSERRGLQASDIVLTNYNSVRRIVEAEFGPGLRFRKITYASELAFLRGVADSVPVPDSLAGLEPRDAPLILSVSRHDARKGLDVFLRALGLLRDAGVRFRACLAGGGSLIARHRRFAAELGLSDCTIIPGSVPDAYACLRHADIFALPSIEEGSGSVSLLEAMQAGVAPVVSRVDGLPEDVIDGESGLLTAPGDAVDLARALRRLIEDAALRARLAQGAQDTYHARFSAKAFAEDLRAIYTTLAFAPSRPDEGGAVLGL